jgi:hypothetical protein
MKSFDQADRKRRGCRNLSGQSGWQIDFLIDMVRPGWRTAQQAQHIERDRYGWRTERVGSVRCHLILASATWARLTYPLPTAQAGSQAGFESSGHKNHAATGC